MPGTKNKVDLRDLHILTRKVERDLNNIGSTMRAVVRYQEKRIEEGFEAERSPMGEPWESLKPETLARKRNSKILQESQDLKNSIEVVVGDLTASLQSELAYSATHQYGDPIRNIPQREFMGFSQADEQEISDILRKDVKKILKRFK